MVSTDNEIETQLLDQDLGIYIQSILIHPSGEYLYAIDPNWPENGGGIYRINIDCQTGELDAPSLLYAGENAAAIEMFEEGIIVAAREIEMLEVMSIISTKTVKLQVLIPLMEMRMLF